MKLIKEIEDKFAKLEAENESLREKIKDLRSKLTSKERIIERLQLKLENQNELERLKYEYDKLLIENNKLKRYKRKLDKIKCIVEDKIYEEEDE